MLLNFPVHSGEKKFLTNYDLFMMPNGVYRAKEIKADNYLYPMYFLKEGGDYIVSTSVYALIHYKKRFIRNPHFQTTHFYRPSFLTIDREVARARTLYRRSSLELTKKDGIINLGAKLIQDYITEIEERYPGWIHVVFMGGKDSQNIILAKRNSPWIVLSGEPNAALNEKFIKDNNINIYRFIHAPNDTDNAFLREEIISSDCMFDIAHLRWTKAVHDIVKEFKGKCVLWIGTSGDGIFSRNKNHRDKDYYAVHDLHVGMAMGIMHQVIKNFLNIPAVSPYQSPQFLDELFYRFDPYFVNTAGDVRKEVGEKLFGRPIKYPLENPTPKPWKRSRFLSIGAYVSQLKKEGILCKTKPIQSWFIGDKERIIDFIDQYSSKLSKQRPMLSKMLFPLRKKLSSIFPALIINRHNIAKREIR